MNDRERRLLILSFLCGIAFFGTLQYAMYVYEDTDGEFEINRNFISDLGHEEDTKWLFLLSMVIGAISVAAFWYISPSMLSVYTANLMTNEEDSSSSRIKVPETLIQYNAYLGMFASLFMPFIAIFHSKNSPEFHYFAAGGFLILMTIAMAVYSGVIYQINWAKAEKSKTPLDDIGFTVVGIGLIGAVNWIFPFTELLTPTISVAFFIAYLVVICVLRYIWQKYLKSLAVSFPFRLSLSLAICFIYLIPVTLFDILVLNQRVRSVVEIGYVYTMILWMTGLLVLMATQLTSPSSDDAN